jgi:hypothetical protein
MDDPTLAWTEPEWDAALDGWLGQMLNACADVMAAYRDVYEALQPLGATIQVPDALDVPTADAPPGFLPALARMAKRQAPPKASAPISVNWHLGDDDD